MIEPIDLSPEVERGQRVADILLMRTLDRRMKVLRYEVTNVIAELNIRFIQYLAQFPYSMGYLVIQCLQDFKRHLAILQSDSKSIDKSLPVAMLNDGTMIYMRSYTRDEFSDGAAVEMFANEQSAAE